jgi:hypothetical protein
MSFKSLNLNRDRIPELLEAFQPGVTVVGPSMKSPGQFEYLVEVEGKRASIQFYFKEDGTTTIQYKTGKHPEVSEAIANYVKENGVIDDRKNFSLSFRHVAKEPFALLVEFLSEELKAELAEDKTENGYRILKVRGKFNDSLTYKYYDNGTLQIQGKPLYLYLETTYFLSEFLDLGDIMAVQSKLYEIPINADEIDYELKALLPRAYTFLDETHRKVLSSSLVLRKLKLPLADYSPFAYPALRSLEGYLKKLLDMKGITVPRDGFGDFFELNAMRSAFLLKEEYRKQIACTATSSAVQSAYSYLNHHRHTLFHAGPSSASTRIIEKRVEADEIITNVLSIIDDSYGKIIG